MAVDVTGNPWVIPAADVSANKIWPSTVFVEHFEFADYSADTDKVQVKDGSGRVVWSGDGEDDLSPVRSGKIGHTFDGMIVDVMDSGFLRVYIR